MYDVLAERIIEALLTTTTQRAAATLAGVSERTIQNYRKRADFQAEYEAAAARVMEERREARKAETATLTEARALAIKTLRRECTSTEMKHTTAGSYDMNAPNRIRAAKALLDLTAPGAKNPEP